MKQRLKEHSNMMYTQKERVKLS